MAAMHVPLLIALMIGSSFSQTGYDVQVLDRVLGPNGGSVISFANGSSSFRYNFNAAYWTGRGTNPDGLIIRVQNVALPGAHSGLAVVRRLSKDSMEFEHVDESRILVQCPGINTSETKPTNRALRR